jgi:long-chain acyl-CoA synthetase
VEGHAAVHGGMRATQGVRRSASVRKAAIATSSSGRRHSWETFYRRICRLAGGLRQMGIRAGDRVAVLMHNSDCYLECYAGIPTAGCVIVPINTRWTHAEIDEALRDCAPAAVIVDETYAAMGRDLVARGVVCKRLIVAGGDSTQDSECSYETLIAEAELVTDAGLDDQQAVGLFYTGGTTGRAKGAMLTHAGVCAQSIAMCAEGFFGERSVFLHSAPMFHMADGMACFALLLSGGKSVFVPTFSVEGVLAAIAREQVTETILVPSMIRMILDHPDLHRYDLSSLQKVLYGASPITEVLLDRAQSALPNVALVQAYGMTELSAVATILHDEHLSGHGRRLGRHRAAGRATFGVDVAILGEDGNPKSAREVGEIVVRSPGGMLGYWNRPDETKAVLRNGWMHTGDAGFMDEDGFLFVVDRIKDMIVTGGENVYSAEVENVLAQHEAVGQVAVIGIPDDVWGEEVRAIIVFRAGCSASADDLISFCRCQIARYKCPRSIEIRTESLPLSGSGKVLKSELRRHHWQAKSRGVN